MKRGEIYIMKGEGYGNVQKGIRPVIVIQNDIGNHYSPTTIVCNITTAKKKILPTHLNLGISGGLHKDSIVLCEQIQTVNKEDLKTYVGVISDQHILEELDNKLLISLGIKENNEQNKSTVLP